MFEGSGDIDSGFAFLFSSKAVVPELVWKKVLTIISKDLLLVISLGSH